MTLGRQSVATISLLRRTYKLSEKSPQFIIDGGVKLESSACIVGANLTNHCLEMMVPMLMCMYQLYALA